MKSDFFTKNRQRVLEKIGDDILVLSAYDAMQQTNDGPAPFVQESNFWWLTGLNLPGWKLLIDGKLGKSWLVAPVLSEVDKAFNSYYSNAEAAAISSIDNFLDEKSLFEKLKNRNVFALKPQMANLYSFCLNPAPNNLWKQAKKQASKVEDVRLILSKLRAIKQPQEIEAIKSAIKISIDGFNLVSQKLSSYKNEAEISADFTHYFMSHQSSHAYEPIVASGKNACTLHYSQNNSPLSGLILLDVGAKNNGYNADITRTYAYGEISSRQKDIHTAVNNSLNKITSYIAPGVLVGDYINFSNDCMAEALVDLGLIKTKKDEVGFRKYYPHAISHGLGVDVHDSLGQPREFKEGMVLTVEPGIYIPEEGVGVRIEDDILVTKTGRLNLTADLPSVL